MGVNCDKTPAMTTLPIDDVIPAIRAALAGSSGLVLQAPPGAGKTTRVPLALLDPPWLAGRRIIMLEPRRLAARAAAQRMAASLDQDVGRVVGYRVRLDAKVSAATRIEVVTEGILTRMLQDDPGLDGVGLVIFDEFHERSLNADLGLALCLQSRAALRDDLRLMVMSATLDGGPVAKLMGDAPVITSEGRSFPVDTRFHARPGHVRDLPAAMAQVIRHALRHDPGDILAFLPGSGEIRRTGDLLAQDGPDLGASVHLLYGDLPQDAQDRAIRPDPKGGRKVILSTAIAESSLTIDGVRVVVDGGLMRLPRFDPSSGMTRLITQTVSRASADQRRGRAGRQGPGVCHRLWTEAEDRALTPFTPPEIADADLAPLMLDLAVWGERDAAALDWLDPPNPAPLGQAQALLLELGAVTADGAITPHGRAMARMGLHPRLGHMAIRARDFALGGLACDLAALLAERDPLRGGAGRDCDIRGRIDALRGDSGAPAADRGALARIRQSAKDWRRRLGLKSGQEDGRANDAGRVLALAYPDRIARRRPGGDARFALSGGRGAQMDGLDRLAGEEWLVAAQLDGERRESRIFLAAPLAKADIEEVFADQITQITQLDWDKRDEVIRSSRQRRLFSLVLDEQPVTGADPALLARTMAQGVAQMGLACLPWTPDLEKWRARVVFAHAHDPDGGWPDLSDQSLLAEIDDWLPPYLAGITRRSHLVRLDLSQALHARLDWDQGKRLDRLVPSHVDVPSGSRIPIDYSGDVPVLAVRLQEMFGCAQGPAVLDGRMPVLLHLLSPARRPVQVTADLASFWANAYRAVKADLKGQYPKHWWPDDPMQAEPTARIKPRK